MAYFRDPDGNALMFHHRYAPKDETIELEDERRPVAAQPARVLAPVGHA